MKNNIHNYEGMLQKTIQRINTLPEISENNRKLIHKFISQLNLEGIGMPKTNRYLQDVVKFNRMLKIDFDKADKEDI
ncbi:hypothetical protein EXS73_00005, partial [Candidatus Pacearchaeota archaeon]|nr:hypothetical protein [Candidatus Pacearchaeota archaeon]